jgi:hypothetical protein
MKRFAPLFTPQLFEKGFVMKSSLSGTEMEVEKARVAAIFRKLSQLELQYIPIWRLMRIFNIQLSLNQTGALRQKFIREAGEEPMERTTRNQSSQDNEAKTLVERLASIASKTYAHRGDAEQIGTEDGMKLIVRELKRYDPTILNRNQSRKLPK